jgi:hypothetical protein
VVLLLVREKRLNGMIDKSNLVGVCHHKGRVVHGRADNKQSVHDGTWLRAGRGCQLFYLKSAGLPSCSFLLAT